MIGTKRAALVPLTLILLGVGLSGCVTPTANAVTGRYATPVGGAPVISNETPYSRALACLADFNAGRPAPRVAVGQIADYTGKEESDGSGRKITQGAALMAISALNKAGVRLVERYDTSVAELELKYANNKLIGGAQKNDPYRKIFAGSIPGSDYYLVGGITELNFNIRSEAADGSYSGIFTSALGISGEAKAYVMNIGLDLRMVDTRTLEVVDVISYQKQIVGREVSAGVFDVLGKHVFNVDIGDSALEPIQLAVRAVVERAVAEMVGRLYHAGPDLCSGSEDHPLADVNAGKYSTSKAAVAKKAVPASAVPAIATKDVLKKDAELHDTVAAMPLPRSKPAKSPQTVAPAEKTTHLVVRSDAYEFYGAAVDANPALRGSGK